MTDPVDWCERKRDEAKDGETAYHYHQMAEMWKGRDGDAGKLRNSGWLPTPPSNYRCWLPTDNTQ